MPTKALTARGIREMDLDERETHADEAVPQRHTRVGQTSRIDEDSVRALCDIFEVVEDLTLVVALIELDLGTEFFGKSTHQPVHVLQGLMTVYVRLTATEKTQVRSVNDRDIQGVSSSVGAHGVESGASESIDVTSSPPPSSGANAAMSKNASSGTSSRAASAMNRALARVFSALSSVSRSCRL
jgi:hypothetical protein